MGITEDKPPSDCGKVWGLFKLPFRNSNTTQSTTTSSSLNHTHNHNTHHGVSNGHNQNSSSVTSVARSLLPTRSRLCLDPRNNLYFPYEPGKQVQSAIRIKNTRKSHVTFKFVEPPENNEKQLDQKRKVKFKIMSLKVKGVMEYVPELFDEQKDQVAVEQILQSKEKLKRQLDEAEATLESRKKPLEDTGPKIIGEGLVIDEWKERRERYLARQQVEGVDSV